MELGKPTKEECGSMTKLALLLMANGIEAAILNDPLVKELIADGDGVDALRAVTKKTGVKLSTEDQLLFVAMVGQ